MTDQASPIFHLSFPVRDLEESVEFYRSVLGGEVGRRTGAFVDILVFGAQLTLQRDPPSVSSPMPRTRHFGWTLPWLAWEQLAAQLERSVWVVEEAHEHYQGELREQGKLMIADPTGNLIELKAYRHPAHVLGSLAT